MNEAMQLTGKNWIKRKSKSPVVRDLMNRLLFFWLGWSRRTMP
jgi:hypothetical protein